MATNLADILRGYITPDVISQAGSKLGESESGISKAISAAIPALLSGLVQKSDDSNVMDNVMGYVREIGQDSDNVLTNPRSLFTTTAGSSASGIGSRLLGLLFGNKQSTVTDAIARDSGIKASSAVSIFSTIGTLLLSYFAKTGTSASDLKSLLYAQKDRILSAVPPGLNLGFGNTMDRDSRQQIPVHNSGSSAGKWVGALLLLMAVSVGIYFFTNTSDKRVEEKAVKNRAVAPMRRTAEPARAATEFRFTLPNSVVIVAPENGPEHKLYVWLNDKSKMVDKTTWFNFDRLLFDKGKATLRPESNKELKDMVEILKAYPKVELKIGGYTDNVGDAGYNLRLSDQRANTVKNEMVKMGIAANRLDAEGYGEQFPQATNDTEEGKMLNRRIAVRVTKK